jgi:large subunit ribosomal protein L22
MTGTKTNELPKGVDTPGVRAQVKYVRTSAYKAREILDLIRGERAAAALEILEFSERDIAKVILKGLESAIANAENNNGIAGEDLYVSACYADEGPTLKRWRPRARGRATRIRKRTCHITIIVSRLPAERLEIIRRNESAGAGSARGTRSAADARRQRVLRSRQAKAEKKAAEEAAQEAAQEHDHDHEHEHGDEEPTAATDAGLTESAKDVAAAEEAEGIVDQQAPAVAAVEEEDKPKKAPRARAKKKVAEDEAEGTQD